VRRRGWRRGVRGGPQTGDDRLSFANGLKCKETDCGTSYPNEPRNICGYCFGKLEVDYDYDAIPEEKKLLLRMLGAEVWSTPDDLCPIDHPKDGAIALAHSFVESEAAKDKYRHAQPVREPRQRVQVRQLLRGRVGRRGPAERLTPPARARPPTTAKRRYPTMQDNQGAGFFRLPDSLPGDLAKMKRMVAKFKDGTVSATQFQVFRVPQGVYEQRESGKFMLRIRLPAGGLLPHQMRVLAGVAETYGNGILHVTTRQDIQVHHVSVDNIHPALSLLASVGLSAKGGGGNSVRNITACGRAGVCPNQAFDVTPHAVALTEFMLADPASFQLPRKYKIGFSGCERDCTVAPVNDLGLIAKSTGGKQSFSVWVAGGMGARSRVADSLEESIDTSEIFNVAEAVKRVFDKHGNRKNKHKARLRFLVDKIGLDAFRDMYRKELHALRSEPVEYPSPRPVPHPQPDAPVLRSLVACTGSSTCRLGICLSRGLADAIACALRKSNIDLDGLGELKIQISGCPSSCGRHPIADIGLFGAVRRIAGRPVPHYVLQLGGKVAEGETRLARGRNSIPARNVPALLVDLIGDFEQSTQYPDFGAYLDAGGVQVADDLAAKYKPVPDFDKDKNFYYDWSADVLFSLPGRGPGECVAGVFDLIDVDLKISAEASAPKTEDAAAMLDAVKKLYDNMDASLKFAAATETEKDQPAAAEPAGAEVAADTSKDFRGVACPLNYVKTKLALEQMSGGEVLSILLDEQGARNVPDSAASDGHELISVTQETDHWKVVIRKGK